MGYEVLEIELQLLVFRRELHTCATSVTAVTYLQRCSTCEKRIKD